MKLLLLAVAGVLSPVLAANFQGSCRLVKVQDQYLSSVCETTRGTEICSQVDLSGCIFNVGGVLTYIADVDNDDEAYPYYDPRNDEENTRTGCQRCRSGEEPWILHCDSCPDGRTSEGVPASFDLSDVVDNQDGWLVCSRTRGASKTLDFCLNRDVSLYDTVAGGDREGEERR